MPDGIYLPRESRREPLWERVDRLRITVTLYTAAFVALSGASLSAIVGTIVMLGWLFVGAENAAFSDRFFATWLSSAVAVYATTFMVGAIAALAWSVFARVRSPRWFLDRVGAGRVPKGELIDSKMALKDMALAAGLPFGPELWVVETPNINAFVYARRHQRPMLGVTRGLVERFTIDQQRAVFASMVARIVRGDSASATALASLMSPLNSWRERRLEYDWFASDGAERDTALAGEADSRAAGALNPLFWVFSVAFVIAGELIAAGQREGQLRSAERADAEGMLLLKDPSAMLSALERAVWLNNYVPGAGDGAADLFFNWSGEGSTDDEDDPEWRRVSRLREVLGVEGVRAQDETLAESRAFAPVAPTARVTGQGSRS